MITQSELKDMFDYKDGQLLSKQKSKRRNAGDVLGTINSNGYLTASVNGKVYRVHRLIYLWHNGYMPSQIDHINRVRDDNRIENLRPCTTQENSYNKKVTSESGVKGVHWHKQISRWVASIRANGRNIHLGTFVDKELAISIASTARNKLHKDFAYSGEQP